MDAFFEKSSIMNNKVVPCALLLNCSTMEEVGLRFESVAFDFFIDIPLSCLFEDRIFKSKKSIMYSIRNLFSKKEFEFSPIAPGCDLYFCKLDFTNIPSMKLEYVDNDFGAVNKHGIAKTEFTSFFYPRCVVRTTVDTYLDSENAKESIEVASKILYETDFVDRFKVSKLYGLQFVTSSQTIALCATEYFTATEFHEGKSNKDFEKEVAKFIKKYSITGYEFDINYHGRKPMIVISMTKDYPFIKISSSANLIPECDSCSIDGRAILNAYEDPNAILFPAFVPTIRPTCKKKIDNSDAQKIDRLMKSGYMETRYVRLSNDEFVVLARFRIMLGDAFTDTVARQVKETLYKGTLGSILNEMVIKEGPISAHVILRNSILIMAIRKTIKVDFTAFGEENARNAYLILSREFYEATLNFGNDAFCKKTADDELTFEVRKILH